MKKNDNIDDLFKSKLEDREFDIKPAFLDDLNDQLDGRDSAKRRKKFIYFFAGIVLVLLLTLVGSMMISEDDSVQQANNESNVSSSDSNNNNDNNNSDSNSGTLESNHDSSNDSSDYNDTSSVNPYRNVMTHLGRGGRDFEKEGGSAVPEEADSDLTKAEQEAERQKLAQQEAVRKAEEEERLMAEQEAKERATRLAEEKADKEARLIAERIAKEKADAEAKKDIEEEATRIAEEKADKEARLIAEREAKEKADAEARARSEEANNASGNDSTSTLNANNETANSGNTADTTSGQTNPNLALETGGENPDLTDEADSTNTDPVEPTEPEVTPDLSKNGVKLSPWSLQLSAGANFVTKNIKGGSPESIAIREAEEANITTPQINLGINYNFKSLILSTGLGYMQYGENLKYTPVITDSSYISSYTTVIDSMTMDTTLVPNYSTISTTNTIAADANKNNRHTYITIPLRFGYQFKLGKKFSITPKGGVDFRFLVGGSGTYVNDGLTGILEERDDVVTVGFNGSIEFAYGFDKLTLFVAPTFNSTFKSFKSMHKYSGIGGVFGVIYKF